MTVRELIAQLQKQPQDMDVAVVATHEDEEPCMFKPGRVSVTAEVAILWVYVPESGYIDSEEENTLDSD